MVPVSGPFNMCQLAVAAALPPTLSFHANAPLLNCKALVHFWFVITIPLILLEILQLVVIFFVFSSFDVDALLIIEQYGNE